MNQKSTSWTAEAFESFYNTLSADERAYFIATTDIFHDKPYNVNGRPSLSNQLQNTIVINQETTYSASTFGVPGTWDLHIASLPFLTRQVFLSSNDNGYQVTQIAEDARAVSMAGLVAWPAEAGGTTFLPSSPYTPSFMDLQPQLFPSWTTTLETPSKRLYYEVLAIGFEVRDVTPDIYKSGSAVLYRLATQNRKTTLNILDRTTGLNAGSPRTEFKVIPMLPSTAQLANQVPTSIVLEAREGSYQMNTIQDQMSDFYCSGNARFHMNPLQPPEPSFGTSWTSGSAFTPTYDYDCPDISGDFDVVGWYATGLNTNAALNVRYRVILSLVPSPQDAQLISLAKVSPDMNSKLDSLISHIQGEFPPGVPVSMNPKGEWFKKVLSIGKRVLPKAIPIVKDLMVGNYGNALNQGANLVFDVAKVEKKQSSNDARCQALESRVKALESLVEKLAKGKSVVKTNKANA